ncbi:MAG: EpsI family protein [Methylobacter sp.]|nr:EpsI family protein [Methylobacter sp.]
MEIRHSQLPVTSTRLFQLRALTMLMLMLMLLTACVAVLLKPVQKIAEQQTQINLETMFPKQFDHWREDDSLIYPLVNPVRQSLINKLYSQILSRAYIDDEGRRIMLSIAYGNDQSDMMQVHKPELCYSAQGFQILKSVSGIFNTGFGTVPVKRLLAIQGTRVEPVTYWITIGGTMTINSRQWKLAQLKYGLTGKVPDGMVFRVSSLGDEAVAYPAQEDFIKALLKVLSPENRKRLIGSAFL